MKLIFSPYYDQDTFIGAKNSESLFFFLNLRDRKLFLRFRKLFLSFILINQREKF